MVEVETTVRIIILVYNVHRFAVHHNKLNYRQTTIIMLPKTILSIDLSKQWSTSHTPSSAQGF